MKIRVPRVVSDFGRRFQEAGYQSFLVGGAVRNLILKQKPADFDITTDAKPDEVYEVFKRVIPTGIKHGTVTVIYKGVHFEVTTFRSEGAYSDSRRPDSVAFVSSIENDLERRDFTINAIAVDAVSGLVTDPHGGRLDLKRGVIRAIGNPDDRFAEDGLRLIRACRFASQLGFEVDPATLAGMKRCRSNIRNVSAERIREENDKILRSDVPSAGYKVMERSGLLAEVFPELDACRGVYQKGDHEFDVLDHLLYSCDGAPKDSLEVRLAALFHDIGKPQARRQEAEDEVIFHGHEKLSADIAQNILRRLKYPKAVERTVTHLVAQHMFSYDQNWTDSAVRRFVKRVGTEHIDQLFSLRIADGYGVRRSPPSGVSIKELGRRIDQVLSAEHALDIKDLAVGGQELAEKAAIPKGPEMGIVLNFLLETVLDDPTQNNPETLLELARQFYTQRIRRP
jgi:poly(A) polymerase/tRNA nucleotidyltransferase (CCA-adding enzyme)